MRPLSKRTMANEAAKARERWQMRLLSTTTMSNELLSTRTLANDVAKHKNNGKRR
jgi:hypothetical protein